MFHGINRTTRARARALRIQAGLLARHGQPRVSFQRNQGILGVAAVEAARALRLRAEAQDAEWLAAGAEVDEAAQRALLLDILA